MRMDEPTASHLKTGRVGEAAALSWYERAGYRLVARNWRCPLGEIDLVVTRGSSLVIVEVKARRGSAFGGPFEAVTWKKQRKLRALAETFLATLGRAAPADIRFDVASVMLDRAGHPSVQVFEQAF